jgi:hypothetical protein
MLPKATREYKSRIGGQTMPFQGSYQEFEKLRYLNTREQIMRLARIIVRDPLSTHIIKASNAPDKICYLVVDRSTLPREGDLALLCSEHGLRFAKVNQIPPMQDIWGKVIWRIQES